MQFSRNSQSKTSPGHFTALIPRKFALLLSVLLTAASLLGCGAQPADMALTKNTYLEMVDWHVTGFWVINSPVVWVRVANYNNVPIKEITFDYDTYDYANKHLTHDTYTIPESSVAPGSMKNFIEQYLGLIDLNSQKLSVKLVSVQHG
jgi:hypothetical protein